MKWTGTNILIGWNRRLFAVVGLLTMMSHLSPAQEIGANDFRISTMGTAGNASIDATDPEVAYSATSDMYVVVWEADDDTSGFVDNKKEIYAQRYNASTGAAIGSRVRISTSGSAGDATRDGENPAIAWDSNLNRFLIVWKGNPGTMTEDEVFGQVVAADLTDISTEFRISSVGPNGDSLRAPSSISVAYNSGNSEYLVVWAGDYASDSYYEIYGQRISNSGAETGSDFQISDQAVSLFQGALQPDVTYNATAGEYLVVWSGEEVQDNSEIYGQRLSGTGAAVGSNDFRISDMGPDNDTTYAASDPAVAWNSSQNEYLVVWKGDDNTNPLVGGEDEVFGQRLSAAGAEIGGNDFRISVMGNDSESNASIRDDYDTYTPSVAFSASAGEYLVTWEGEDDFEFLTEGEIEIFGQRITGSSGGLNGPNLRLSDMGPDRSSAFNGQDSSVAAGPSGEWLVVFEGEDNTGALIDGEDEIFGQRYSNTQLNNDPQDVLLSRTEFPDDVPNGGVVAEIGALDADTLDSFTFTLVAGSGDTDNGSFTISANQLIANTTFDAGVKSSYAIRLQVNDGLATAQHAYVLTVTAASETLLGNRFRLSTILPDGIDNGFDHIEAATVYNSTSDEFLVAWIGESNQGGLIENDTEIFVRRVDAVTMAPIGSPIRISDVRGLGNTAGYVSAVHLAWNSSNNEYLVAWVADDTATDNENEIFGQRLTATATETGANDFRISSLGPNANTDYGASEVKVAYNATANEYLVVFEGDHNGTGLVVNQHEIFVQRINAQTGALTGGMRRISNANTDSDSLLDADKPTVAWNSLNNLYLVVWIDERTNGEDEIYGQLLNADGSENGSDFRISTLGPEGDTAYDADLCSIAYNSTDNEFLVVWEGEDNTAPLVLDEIEIFGRRINAQTGALLGSQTRYSDAGPNGSSLYTAQDPQVSYGAAKNEYLIVWQAENNEGTQIDGEVEIFAQRVNAATGAEINGDERISEMGPVGSDDYDARYANLAYDHERHRYMIIWDADDNTSPLIEGENEVYAQFWQLPPPKVSGITRNNTNPTSSSTLSWTVAFTESVTGIDVTDFALSLNGSTVGSIQSVSSSAGSSITVSAHNVSGDGTIGLNLVDNDSIQNAVAIPLGGAGADNGSYIGQQYTSTGSPPAFSMVFSPDTISIGQTSTLTLTIDNTANSQTATGLSFTNNLPAGLTIAYSTNATTTCTGGTLTAVAGSGTFSYIGGSIGASSSCTVQVDVTGNAAGTHLNVSGVLTSSAGNSGTASDSLLVEKQPASVTLSSINQTYNGSARMVAITTVPSNLTVNITYDGSSSGPTNAGSYTVIATINESMYQGSTTGTLSIAKAAPSIAFSLPAIHSVNSPLTLSATSGSPASFSYSIVHGTASISNANIAVFGAAEVIGIMATQANSQNWNTASVTNVTTTVKDQATVTLSNTEQAYSGSARSITVTTAPAGLPVDILYDGNSAGPTNVGQYAVSATINSGRYIGSTNGVLNISKALATLTLSGTNQTYDGTARVVSASTVPSNLTVNITYDSSVLAPTNAGSYSVIARVDEAMYSGGFTGTLSIAKADPTIEFTLPATYSVNSTLVLSSTSASPVSVSYSIAYGTASISNENIAVFSAAEAIGIVAAQSETNNWNATAITNVVTTTKDIASITLSDTNQTYTGAAQMVSVTTVPSNLTVNITYDSSVTAPTNAGVYTVIASIDEALYLGSTTGTLSIAKADPVISFTLPATNSVNTPLALSATSGSPAAFSYSVAYGTASISNANIAVFGAAEAIGLIAAQSETNNWNAASITNETTIIKDQATVTLSNTEQIYSGSSRSITVTTVPAGLPVDILYDGNSAAPTNVGPYNVSATINSGRYIGSTNGVLNISKALATLTLSGTNQTYDGTARVVSASTVPSNLTVNITYDSSVLAPTNAGSYTVIAHIDEAMYYGGFTGTLSVAKADQTIDFPAIAPQSVVDTVQLSATAESEGTVGFAVSAPGSISANTNLSFTAAGRVEVTANQPGDSNWNSAPQVARSFDVIGVITNVAPETGTIFGGTEVLIEGLWLGDGTDITNVMLCGIEATIVSQGVHQVMVLSGATNSPVAITGAVEVVSGFGTAILTNAFIYNPVPEAPVALSAVDIAPDRFTARWLTTADTTGYYVDVSSSTNFTDFVGVYSNWYAGNTTEALVTGLVDGETYWYRVRAANPYGSSFDSNMIEAPVGANTPYINYETTNGVASAGSTNTVDLTELFHGSGMTYTVVSNSNPSLVTASIAETNLVLVYADGVTGSADITVRVTDPDGFWVETTITVQVIEQPGIFEGPIAFNLQNGFFEQVVSVTNNSASLAAKSISLTLFNLSAGTTVHNATGQDGSGNPMIRWNGTLAPLGSMDFTIQYYSALGTMPSSDVVAALSLEDVEKVIHGQAVHLNGSPVMINGTQSFLIEFTATPGQTYYVQYKDSLMDDWISVPLGLEAIVNKVQWIDSGPPSTLGEPVGNSRFYRIIEENND